MELGVPCRQKDKRVRGRGGQVQTTNYRHNEAGARYKEYGYVVVTSEEAVRRSLRGP